MSKKTESWKNAVRKGAQSATRCRGYHGKEVKIKTKKNLQKKIDRQSETRGRTVGTTSPKEKIKWMKTLPVKEAESQGSKEDKNTFGIPNKKSRRTFRSDKRPPQGRRGSEGGDLPGKNNQTT